MILFTVLATVVAVVVMSTLILMSDNNVASCSLTRLDSRDQLFGVMVAVVS